MTLIVSKGFNPQWVQLDIKQRRGRPWCTGRSRFNPQWVQLDIKLWRLFPESGVSDCFNPQWVQLDIKSKMGFVRDGKNNEFQSSVSAIRYKECLRKPLTGKGCRGQNRRSWKNQRCQRTMVWFHCCTASVSYAFLFSYTKSTLIFSHKSR